MKCPLLLRLVATVLVFVSALLVSRGAEFEQLSIAGHLNAATPDGERGRALNPGKVSIVDGVPFQFPIPEASGKDHIDVGQSWTRFGALAGYFRADSGEFGGRWTAADRLDPSRIAMYVPKGRYKALHLMAVADGRKDSVPIVTAQFYRPNAGFPVNFAGTVPVKSASGKKSMLHHVVIPLDPDGFSWFSDLDRIGMELTKQVQFYRSYPDPLEYSWHGAGLPSSVQIYAMTLERVGVDADVQPDQVGHVWTAPATPSYTIQFLNTTGTAATGKLVVTTKSDDGEDQTHQELPFNLPAGSVPVKVQIHLKPTRYGLHELALNYTTGAESVTLRRSFAWLHEDTRERGNWEQGRGSIFGFWAWNGALVTPGLETELPVMAAAGAESVENIFDGLQPAIQTLAEKLKFTSEAAFDSAAKVIDSFSIARPPFDATNPEASGKAVVEELRKHLNPPSPICRPTYIPFFGENQVGRITTGVWPTYYGEGEYQFTKDDEAALQDQLTRFLVGARAVRKQWPHLKILLPHGDPLVTAVFLKRSPEARELIDGCAVDMPGFERIPEQQIHHAVMHRLYPILKDIKQYKKNPYLVLVEGTCTSSRDIDTGEIGQADITIRNMLVLMGYDVARFECALAAFDCAGYWGENHYGGGWCNRLPLITPKPAFVHYATMTRHLNRANFTQYIPTGSTSTYCEQFKHYKSGKLIHVLWTVRGKRPVTIKISPGTTLELYDPNDNVTMLKEKDGVITFTMDQSPRYLEGLEADPVITLGGSDHSDSLPGSENAILTNLGDGSWKQVDKEDEQYTKSNPLQIERFPGNMSVKVVEAPAAQGERALAVHFDQQPKDRGVMPFYTTLEPKRPVTIPGKASHLGLWVNAASDWGRVVYCLRDAKGEPWISVGSKEQWNCDDIHCWSSFCFDGWRYLRFELPSNAPYDCYRDYGSTWWGSSGGDGVVDLPLKLERVIVERRPRLIYGNDLVPAKADDVLLGELRAEYASAADRGDEAIRLSRIRMPMPKNLPELGNPIAELGKTGVGAPTKALRVTDPQHQYDGTRCHVHFELVPGAKTYNVWVSPYADGRGALLLGKDWTESGKLIEGLRADTEFFAFVVYTDSNGRLSKPSPAFRFLLKDRFFYR